MELTGDDHVFVYLHKYFVFLLKAGGQRVVECVLEGPPQVGRGGGRGGEGRREVVCVCVCLV